MSTVDIPAEVVVVWQQNSQHAASCILLRISQTGSYFPINMFALPSAPTCQYNSYTSIRNEFITYLLTNSVGLQIHIDISVRDGFVDDVRTQHFAKPCLVSLILAMVIAYKYLMPSCRSH